MQVAGISRRVRYSYLPQQFADPGEILARIAQIVGEGSFTLGAAVGEFERKFAELIGTRYAVGVGSGTDAIKLSLRASGIGHGDEVITAANTFVATVGAIAEVGARPVFVDCNDSFCMDVTRVEAGSRRARRPSSRSTLPARPSTCRRCWKSRAVTAWP